MNDINKLSEKYQKSVINHLEKLVSYKSFSTLEKEIADYYVSCFQDIADEISIDVMGNVIARMGHGPKKLVFDGHLDVVEVSDPSKWKYNPFKIKCDGDKIYGLGTSDQKSSIAAMIIAAKIIKDIGVPDDLSVYFVGSVQEEGCEGLNWDVIINETKLIPDFVVLTEPSNGEIAIGQRGKIEFEINIEGKSAHGSMPQEGVNAIYESTRFINAIEKMDTDYYNRNAEHKPSIAITNINGYGPSLCAVPDVCRMHIDRRTVFTEKNEDIINEIKKIFSELKLNGDVNIPKYDLTSYKGYKKVIERIFPAWITDKDSELVQIANKTFKKIFDKEPVNKIWKFSTNGVSIAGRHNISTIGYGAGIEELAHKPNEYTLLSSMINAVKFYSALCYVVSNEKILSFV